jgi:hypothetical protein
MKATTLWATGAVALLASVAALGGNQDTVLTKHAFDADNNGWNVESSNGAITEATKTEGEFKAGTGALKVKYTVEKGHFSALTLPVADGKWAKMQQMKFWLKTDRDAIYIVSLHEKEGGHYNTTFWCPKGVWQQILLTPSDFALGTEGNEPKDPNNKLDTDRIEKILLLDLANILFQAENPENGFFKVVGGERNLWIDDFEVRSDAPPLPKPADDKSVTIDDFRRDFLLWLPVGTASPVIQIDKGGKPLEGRALKADYILESGKFGALMRPFGKNLSGNKTLAFDIASEKGTKLLVMLEEKGGGKYNATIEVEGEKKPVKKTVKFEDFKLADDSPADTNGKLDLDSLKLIGFLDLGFFEATEKRPNTLWVANLRAVP